MQIVLRAWLAISSIPASTYFLSEESKETTYPLKFWNFEQHPKIISEAPLTTNLFCPFTSSSILILFLAELKGIF